MRNMRSLLTASLLICVLGVFTAAAFAATESELTDLLRELKDKERALYTPEFTYDGLLKQHWEFDGFGGWFRKSIFGRSAYKRLTNDLNQKEAACDRILGELNDLRRRVQDKVYDIAYSCEESGAYQKAIEWYLKLESVDDKIKFRIATCYKKDSRYADAIQWFFDIDYKDDHVKFGLAESYELWGKFKDAATWYFNVCEAFRDEDIERSALGKLESLDYPDKIRDFPDFYRRVSDIYIARVFLHQGSDSHTSREAYRQAAVNFARYLETDSEKEASRSIVTRYRRLYRTARQVLEEQQEEAEEYYNEKLREAGRQYEWAKDEYEDELEDAKNSYSRKLSELFCQYRDYDDRYERYKNEGRSQEEIDSAERWRDYYRREHAELGTHWACERYIEDYVEDEKERMEEAEEEYEEIGYRREEIIREYLEPYRRNLKKARETFDIIRDLHDEIYG